VIFETGSSYFFMWYDNMLFNLVFILSASVFAFIFYCLFNLTNKRTYWADVVQCQSECLYIVTVCTATSRSYGVSSLFSPNEPGVQTCLPIFTQNGLVEVDSRKDVLLAVKLKLLQSADL